ncbi:MAG: monovalent cation/H+ antiporter subunit D family protein, partial [Desulfobacula sp.]|nr:monovalent cation/H+ antiporter subunit D family protein [Desulfobacula sp.]
MDNYPALIVVTPLLAALLAGLAAWIEDRLSYPIALIGLALSTFFAFKVLMQVIGSGAIHYRMAGWAPPMGIEYSIDLLNALVLLLVSGIAFFNLVASYQSVNQETNDRAGSFYTIYLLFVTGLLGVTATGDLFNLYVLIEITSLT